MYWDLTDTFFLVREVQPLYSYVEGVHVSHESRVTRWKTSLQTYGWSCSFQVSQKSQKHMAPKFVPCFANYGKKMLQYFLFTKFHELPIYRDGGS